LAWASTPWLGVLLGAGVTALIQSSSVTTGVAVLLVQQGVLPAESAISLVVGANVGSTSTALVASAGMSRFAKATARANLLFNLVGMLAFLPFLDVFARAVVQLAGGPALSVAWAHVVFNLTLSMGFLLVLRPIEPWLRRWVRCP